MGLPRNQLVLCCSEMEQLLLPEQKPALEEQDGRRGGDSTLAAPSLQSLQLPEHLNKGLGKQEGPVFGT